YYLIDYRGYAGYEPGDNVIHIFSMGSLTTEAIKASEFLLTKGIYANVIVVTSPDLLLGIQAHEQDYQYLKTDLQILSDLYIKRTGDISGSDLVTISGKRVPIVSVHDGEPGLLDNIGSVVGVKQIACAVRKHSKCGRPTEVYHFHNIDTEAIVEACGRALAETAMEQTMVRESSLSDVAEQTQNIQHWAELWPTKNNQQH
ncbi:MAG TPA: pyruvate dehydrogenase, partial [Pseudobdellovibrionaceae bacterium]|nr:pyruvate dehydrogenase [Pseudobdellovibrionaceae bacterium]